MPRATAWVLAAVPALASAAAWSASLHVAPVNLRLEVGQQAAGLTLTNTSNQPLVAQVRIFGWSQDLHDDHLDPPQDMVASPPIVTIPAQGEQYVRVVRTDRAVPRKELSYRLLIDELPGPPGIARSDGAIDIRLRYSIPLFVEAAGQTAAVLGWELERHEDAWFMRVTNSGGTHAQLSAVTLLQSGGAIDLTDGLLGYALAGGAREWPLSAQSIATGLPLRVKATVNGTVIDTLLARPTDGGVAERR